MHSNARILEKAIEGCDAIHISLANVDEALTTRLIVDVAKQHQIKYISLITGCTVCEENRWFPMIDTKTYVTERSRRHRNEELLLRERIRRLVAVARPAELLQGHVGLLRDADRRVPVRQDRDLAFGEKRIGRQPRDRVKTVDARVTSSRMIEPAVIA